MTLSISKVTPRQARKHIIRCMEVGLVPFLQSSPAMGKSAIVASIANEYGLALIDHRLSTSAPEDLSGLPHFTKEGTATFAAFDIFPTTDTPIPEGKGGWLVFLDEFNSASKMVQAAAYKLILDRMVGQKKLHPNVVLVAAGNLSTDRAIVNPISTAMQSRLIHLEMHLDFDEFIADVALPQAWDGRVIAYLSYKKAMLHDFRADHNEKTFCSPRTWDFVNRLIKGRQYKTVTKGDLSLYEMDAEAALYSGAITAGVAVDFINFTKVYETLPKIGAIIADPAGITLPSDSATRWATITHLIENATEENGEALATFIGRLPTEFRVLFFRGLKVQKPALIRKPAYYKAMVAISKYLYDEDEEAPAAA